MTGPVLPVPSPSERAEWENEGGSLAEGAKPDALPEGIIAIPVTHYRVGEFTYTNLDDALSQHRRTIAKPE